MTHSYPKIRLFVEPDEIAPFQRGGEVLREGDAAHYLTRVMRLKEGDVVALFNGRDGEWAAEFIKASKKQAVLRLVEHMRDPLSGPDVWVCFAPLKFGRVDYLVQKLTELGAAKLVPTITEHTRSDKVNAKRYRANMIEAAEQCERAVVPELAEPIKLARLLAEWPKDRALIFADESGQGALPADALKQAPEQWGLLIGPEGGFSAQERELIYSIAQARGISLGPRILRADTAAMTLLSLTMAVWGDWDERPRFNQGDKK